MQHTNIENTYKLKLQIAEILKEKSEHLNVDIIIASYFLYKTYEYTKNDCLYKNLLKNKNFIDEDVLYSFKENITEPVWNELIKLTLYNPAENFLHIIFSPISSGFKYADSFTPKSVIELSQKILNCKPNEKVADIGCGIGSFIISAAEIEPNAYFDGYEINVRYKVVSSIRSELLKNKNVNVYLKNAFQIPDTKKYDKIFSNYPFGMRLKDLGEGIKYIDDLSAKYSGITRTTSSDWIFNALLCSKLEENGKAVAIMTNGSLWNRIDMPLRKYFIEQGLVEAVIALPERMFDYTPIQTSLIILSKNNMSVRLIDASNLCKQERRQNVFTKDNIEAIYDALKRNSEFSKDISLQQLRDNEYTLNLRRYLSSNEINFKNGVPFESVIKNITRGAPLTASQLDQMSSNKITNIQYLMLNNIQNGLICNNLPYLTSIESKYEKYCLKNNNLIISKIGFPYKVAVANIEDGHTILANGNLYIIELDETKVKPYFLKAFFESEKGISVLNNITVGASIPSIGIDNLKRIIIPLPSMEEQEQISLKYQATLDEISILNIRLEKAVNKLYHIFDSESEE